LVKVDPLALGHFPKVSSALHECSLAAPHTTTTDIAPDWAAAERVAGRLGAHSRELVASRDAEAVIAWALDMASDNGNGRGPAREAAYLELAGLAGNTPGETGPTEQPEREFRGEEPQAA
jgi:hypothetical protein